MTVQVDDPAILDDHGEMLATLQYPDIGQWIALENDQIGQTTGLQHSHLLVQTEHKGIIARAGDNRLHGRVAPVVHQNGGFVGV